MQSNYDLLFVVKFRAYYYRTFFNLSNHENFTGSCNFYDIVTCITNLLLILEMIHSIQVSYNGIIVNGGTAFIHC